MRPSRRARPGPQAGPGATYGNLQVLSLPLRTLGAHLTRGCPGGAAPNPVSWGLKASKASRVGSEPLLTPTCLCPTVSSLMIILITESSKAGLWRLPARPSVEPRAPCFPQASAQMWPPLGGVPFHCVQCRRFHFLPGTCHPLTCFLSVLHSSSLSQLGCSTRAGVFPWSLLSPQSSEQCLGQRCLDIERGIW